MPPLRRGKGETDKETFLVRNKEALEEEEKEEKYYVSLPSVSKGREKGEGEAAIQFAGLA